MEENMETFSRHLCDMVSQMDHDFVNDAPPDERAEVAEWVASNMTAYLLESFAAFKAGEGVSGEGVSVLENLFATQNETILKNRFDECYTRQLLQEIPKMVTRTMRLSQMLPRKMPSRATNTYLKEATRSYIFGLWQGCIALSRAAVENGLRQEVTRDLKPGDNPKSQQLIATASRMQLLDYDHAQMAERVVTVGNRVLHGEPSNDKESFACLEDARKVLLRLYGLSDK
jgi:hypothetical protein